MTRRDAALWGTLALTLLLTGWTALLPDDPEPVIAAGARAAADLPPGPAIRASESPLRGPWLAPTDVALAAWSVPSVVPPEPAPSVEVPSVKDTPPTASPAPVAPALPWRWLGRLDDAAGPRALLDGPGGARLVREAEVLDGQWRVDRIGPDRLHWTWLPANQPRTVNRS